jgi:iron complex outermembrane receptor protein
MHNDRSAFTRSRAPRAGRALIAGLTGALALLARVTPAAAQDTSSTARLPTVQVTVTRETARSPLELPYAISVTQPDSLRPGSRQLALDELLLLIPGIAVSNRNNPTQDPRVTIRGFGARSAFGVRGVRVLRDGIPLTLPDGQTPIDYVDLESVESIQVIRGAASALYGNASGGVIDLRTGVPPPAPFGASLRASGGSYGMKRLHGMAGGTSDPFTYQASVTRTEMGGFRDYSRQETTHALARAELRRGSTTWSLQGIGFDMPVADNPGALTAAQFATNPRMAEVNTVRTRARKDVRQGQLSLAATRSGDPGELSAAVYGGARDLYNPLAFGIIAVDRVSYGTTLRATMAPRALPGGDHRISLGLDAQRQEDDRERFENCNDGATPIPATCSPSGSERGALVQSQRELVTGIGVYLRDEVALNSWLTGSAGVRQDITVFEIDDRFITADDPDDSDDRSLPALTGMGGLVARLGALTSLYANVSSSFETPTATEVVNKPDGSAGINPDLEAQRALSYEIGAKGFILPAIAYDGAIFLTRVRGELIPFEVPGGGGRRYFRNAGRTERRGLELGVRAEAGPVRAGLSYSYADYEFTDYKVVTGSGATADTTVFDGKRIPGIPVHQAQASLTWLGANVHGTLETIAVSRTLVDDANSASAAGYGLVNLRVGGFLPLGAMGRVEPVVGVHNLFDRSYVGSVSVNAAPMFGRYYEPAPGRTIYAGLTITR